MARTPPAPEAESSRSEKPRTPSISSWFRMRSLPASSGRFSVSPSSIDPGLGRLVQRSLQARGLSVELAASGEEGLVRAQAGGFDLIALDHHMPGQTGLDLLPELRSLPEAPPVIYVTGSEDSRVAVAALKAGAVDYVWKDVQGQFRELLGEAVDTALRQEALRRDKERAEAAVREARDRAELLLREVNHRVDRPR